MDYYRASNAETMPTMGMHSVNGNTDKATVVSAFLQLFPWDTSVKLLGHNIGESQINSSIVYLVHLLPSLIADIHWQSVGSLRSK